MIVNYDCNCSFIVLATVITIVNYNRKTFIVQATGDLLGQLEELGIDSDIGCRLLLLPDVDVGVFPITDLGKVWSNLSEHLAALTIDVTPGPNVL